MFKIGRLLVVVTSLAVSGLSTQVLAADEPARKAAATVDGEAAESLARREGCLKCHAPYKDKEGPAFRKVAAKYKDKADAEALIFKHITSGELVKFPDGEEEEHRIIKSTDEGAVGNLIRWILSR